jgi:DNA polymerase-3 subunit gamma/tau
VSYLVLARKWRPQTFDDVVGQRSVTQTLRNAIAGDRIAHALLFAGPRGIGKTTTARIVAKALNCDRGRSSDPCNECESCKGIAGGRSIDCLEIDGASNRGIDEVRELREIVRYAPSQGKWKVVIIDEVHMLTEPAFNALLKTLEEPPSRVLFILATTDAHKIPATILSRCQRHDFRKLGHGEIAERLQRIAREEQLTITDGALHAIARAADGSLRDAQSVLDQVIAYAGGDASEIDVGVVLGLPEGETVAGIAQAIIDRDSQGALALVESLSARGHDLQRCCQELLAHLRDLMVAKTVSEPAPLLQTSRVPLETLRSQAAALSLSQIEAAFQVLSRAEFEMRRSPQPRFVLEMALVEAAEARSLESLAVLLQRLSALEERLVATRDDPPIAPESALPLFAAPRPPVDHAKPSPPRRSPDQNPAGPGDRPPAAATGAQEGWAQVARLVEARKRSLATLLAGATEVRLDQDTLTVTIENGTTFARSTLQDAENRQLAAAAAAEVFGRHVRIEYRFLDAAAARLPGQPERLAPQGPGEGRPEPFPREEGDPGSTAAGVDALRRHPLVERAVELFGGQVVQVKQRRAGGDAAGRSA